MAIRDRAGAYRRRSLEERGKPPFSIIGPLVVEFRPAEALALAEGERFIVICEMSSRKKERTLTNTRKFEGCKVSCDTRMYQRSTPDLQPL